MKPKFKLNFSDTKESITMYFNKEPQTLEDMLSKIKRALLAWGYSIHHIDKYFNQDKYIKKLEEKISHLENKLKKSEGRIFTLPFIREK